MLVVLSWWGVFLWSVDAAVLDPALYLLPSPPLVSISKETNVWTDPQPRIERQDEDAEELVVIPIRRMQTETPTSIVTTRTTTEEAESMETTTEEAESMETTTEEAESMEKSETFWPGMRSTSQFFGSIHVPLTFSLSGSYGKYQGLSKGIVASTYGSVSDILDMGNIGKSGLAGSAYGTYSGYPGTRIYRGGGRPSWSGWGNGKWGHYGKG